MDGLGPFIGLIGIVIGVLNVIATINILQKAGYSGWNVLWLLVPVLNVVMFFVFAFSVWPIERKVAMLKQPWALGDAGNRQ